MKYQLSIIFLILGFITDFVKSFDPYVSNQSQTLSDIDIVWDESNKDYTYLKEIDIHAYYIVNDDDDRHVYPAIQPIQNGQQLGNPIKLVEQDLEHKPNGLNLCKTGDDSFVLFFTFPNDDQFTYIDENGNEQKVEYYEQHIRFVHFTRFNSKRKQIQSEIITVAINENISYDRPKCTYVPSEDKVIFIYGDNEGNKIYTNTIHLSQEKKYELEHGLDGKVLIQKVDNYMDRFRIAHLSDDDGLVITYSLRPANIFDSEDITTKLIVEHYQGDQVQDTEISPSNEILQDETEYQHKWTFEPKLAVNEPEKKFILSWWEDLSVRYQIFDFGFNKVCDNEILLSQKPSVTTWGDLGIISFRNSTGNFVEEINLDTCDTQIDKLKEFYSIWGNGTLTNAPVDIRIQKGQEVTLQVVFQDSGSSETKQLSYSIEQCPPGCGDCDNPTECNACVPSKTNAPACDICNDGYVEKNNECLSCNELYGSQCHTCNEFNCLCEGPVDTCDKCVGLFRDINSNCACQEGFSEDIVTKNCEFTPCKKGYYEYSYRCIECYWIKNDDTCYQGQCPTFYIANQETLECYKEKASLIFLFIFGGLALIIIIMTLIFIKHMYNKRKTIQNEPILQTTNRIQDMSNKGLAQPESSLDLTKHKQSVSINNMISESGQQ